jgi:hypothetical protein
MSIRHKYNSPVSDTGIPPNLVKPSDWNDEHDIDGLLGALLNVGVANKVIPYLDGAGAGGTTPLSDLMKGLLALTTVAEIISGLGIAPIDSPTFTGTPSAPTAGASDNTTRIATTAFVQAVIGNLINSAPGALDTLNELAAALGNDPNFATTVTNALATKAPLNSPALTGTPTAPTVAGSTDSTTKLATTAFVQACILALAAVARTGAYSDLTGKPTLGTAAALNVGTGNNQVVQLDGSAKLPAVDGSALINVVATSVNLTTGNAVLGADVNLTPVNTYVDVLTTGVLPAGKYLIVGIANVKDTGASVAMSARLYDGTTTLGASGIVNTFTAAAHVQLMVMAIVTNPAAAIRLQAKNASTANGKAVSNDSGDGKDTNLSWIKIG